MAVVIAERYADVGEGVSVEQGRVDHLVVAVDAPGVVEGVDLGGGLLHKLDELTGGVLDDARELQLLLTRGPGSNEEISNEVASDLR
ncbi:hypothetical protein [Microtetraspora malaysiensis]|uniref:Uncharacterized protein n=1 Tax=Microtetraspora malaysiensis TaxID=161358 RepID=A0ABW6T1N1_9ACTN